MVATRSRRKQRNCNKLKERESTRKRCVTCSSARHSERVSKTISSCFLSPSGRQSVFSAIEHLAEENPGRPSVQGSTTGKGGKESEGTEVRDLPRSELLSVMGREVTGVSEEHDPSLVKMKWNGVSLDTGHEINSKASGVSIEVKDHHMKAGTGDNSAVERSHEKQDILAVKSTNCTDEKHDLKSTKFEDQKSSSPRKPASGPVAAGNVRIKHSVQKPLDLMSEKHAFIGLMAAETPIAGGDSSPNMNSQQSPSTTKKSQPNSAIVSRKQLDDNDNWSLASSYPFFVLFFH
ncbi:hypothetical protein Nepgr_001435 [Nepenthes gracilis]|uniref:Uncharacterized protein n=1 Tax=Nepenthes gracilis TaxID=150966 RepID=A0AAD3P4U1_NEPGR|nr:hypothetical protein Nepgr_001435 [Nepenthes gracilis]